MRILVIDTATRRASVAAVQGGAIVAAAEHEGPTQHAENLFGMVRRVLEQAGWESDIDLLAVGMGPGSFTGVRVGMAAAKGYALARAIPVIGVTSLDAMVRAAGAAHWPCVAMVDAKKSEVFLAAYGADGECVAGPLHLSRDAVASWLEARPGGASAHALVGEVVEGLGVDTAGWVRSRECDLPGPESMAAIAEETWQRAPVDQLESLEPLYVRPPDITLPASKSTRATPCA